MICIHGLPIRTRQEQHIRSLNQIYCLLRQRQSLGSQLGFHFMRDDFLLIQVFRTIPQTLRHNHGHLNPRLAHNRTRNHLPCQLDSISRLQINRERGHVLPLPSARLDDLAILTLASPEIIKHGIELSINI